MSFAPRRSFLAGLLLTTLATLMLEILDTRLLSVLTWYHLSFFAVSTALFGMSAGAVRVYLGGDRFAADRAPQALARYATGFALSIPLAHVANLLVSLRPFTRGELVAISLWGGIDASLILAAGCYALLAVPAATLWRSGAVRTSRALR